MIKILIVDDHAIFREGIKAVLEKEPKFQVVGEATDGSHVVSKVAELNPEVILMDIRMPYSGLMATIDTLKKYPAMNIVMLTISEKEADLIDAIRAGARGYLLKDMGLDDLVSGIKSVASGGAIFTPSMASKLLDDFVDNTKKKKDNVNLTERELDVLHLVASGASNKEIAVQLHVSEPTVKTHLRNILGKLHLKNRSQAAVYASQHQLINNDSTSSR